MHLQANRAAIVTNDDYRARFGRMVADAALAGQRVARAAAEAGGFPGLRLYYQPATADRDGRLMLVRADEAAPAGFEPASAELLAGNVEYVFYGVWIAGRASALPIFAGH